MSITHCYQDLKVIVTIVECFIILILCYFV